MYYTKFESGICEIILVGNEEALTYLHLNTGKGKRRFNISSEWERRDRIFIDAVKQVKKYLRGELKTFSVLLAPEGTEYQKKVWRELQKIPFGETRTYKDIAANLGNANSARAVGMANSKNPIPIIIPCHRVIGSSGELRGFAHGLDVKRRLLDLESDQR